ncbi:MAG: hypothetical protein U0W24_20805 [Bacteroidales bacterium]
MKVPEQNIEFQLKAIELIDVNLKHPAIPFNQPTLFHFNINIEHKINPDNNLVIVIAFINILHEDKETNLGSLKSSCIFEIVNFNEFYNKETNQVSFPDNILVTLNSITISTVRGIMFSQFKGTFLHNAILPIIDPKSFTVNK